jgi:tRNA U54 and U55 pseudouridine synthase Pus10
MPGFAEKTLAKKGGALRTHIQMGTTGTELFKRYDNSCTETIDATFNVKDFAVIVQFCKSVQADVTIRMSEAGTPLMVEAAWESSDENDAAEHVQAELLLATIHESVQVCAAHLHAMLPHAPVSNAYRARGCARTSCIVLYRRPSVTAD